MKIRYKISILIFVCIVISAFTAAYAVNAIQNNTKSTTIGDDGSKTIYVSNNVKTAMMV
jgi:hypothetical protein